MKKITAIALASLMAGGFFSTARADECAGAIDLAETAVGCDIEISRAVSLAKCDFGPDKTPIVTLRRVIDGRLGNDTVTVQASSPSGFSVKIEPLPSYGSESVCKVWSFEWSAE